MGRLVPKAAKDIVVIPAQKIENIIDENEVLNLTPFNATSTKDADIFVESFWYWKKFTTYLIAFAIMIGVLTVLTFLFEKSEFFVALLGTASSMIEALLGMP